MIANRSVPAETLIPHVHYGDVQKAIGWLTNAFGFSEHYRYGDPVSGAQLHLGNAWIMLKERPGGAASPAELGYGTQSLTVFVEDVQAHFERALQAGAIIVEQPHETGYGEFQYAVKDFEGHLWLFSKHARDVSPEDWGATIAHNETALTIDR